MYAGYEYYSTEYKGTLDEDAYLKVIRKADRVLDKLTHNRLLYAFPVDVNDIDNVYQCECQLVDYEYNVEQAIKAQATGNVVKSVSSGSESVTYDTNIYAESAKNEGSHMQGALNICRIWLGGVPDAKGTNLLYAGI